MSRRDFDLGGARCCVAELAEQVHRVIDDALACAVDMAGDRAYT